MALKKTKYDLLVEIINSYLADGTIGLAQLKAYVDTLETALGNPTGDMDDVAQADDATLAAFVKRFKEHYRAHDQTRICFVIPGAALDVPNTAIKDELDKIGTVSVLTEAGCAASQEDWNVYDLIVVGTDSATGFTNIANIDTLITIKLPIVVCCSSAAEKLKMGTAAAQSTSDTDEHCESVANRVMYRVFTTTGQKVLFSENAESDRLNMSHGDLTEQVLMVQAPGDPNTLVVVGWLPMETATGVTNKLIDIDPIPAGRVFAGCFYEADKLTDLGKDLLRALCRNITQASITPSISLKAQAALVAAIHNDTDELQTDWHDGGRLDLLLDAIEGKLDKTLFSMDFWSDPQEEIAVPGAEATLVFTPTVSVADLPATATIVRAIAMFKFRMVENTYDGANALDGATEALTRQVIQVKETADGAYIDAINFVDNQFTLDNLTREGGDVLIGSINIVGEVDDNGNYTFQWLLRKCDTNFINFNDCQVGIRIWYSI